MRLLTLATLATVIATPSVQAAVDHVDILTRLPVQGGQAFGAAGAYEALTGRIYYTVQPSNPHNQGIVDVDKAPLNPTGAVAFSSDFVVLKPVQASLGNGALLLEIANRGGKGMLGIIDGAKRSEDFGSPGAVGDGWLLRQGYTLAWVGWQWDVAPTPGALRLYAPIAREHDGSPIRGLLRDDFTLPSPRATMPLGHLISGTIGGTEYPASDPTDPRNVLTVRDSPLAERQLIPRDQWAFAHSPGSPAWDTLTLKGGFTQGRIYELVYAVQDPVVAGLGFAAIRDFVASVKHGPSPLGHVDRAYAMGISQTGRFLRHFLYEDFNADEQGRQVLDGVLAHVAGAGRGSFNHRFAQPSRDGQSVAALFYPTDLFPFTDLPETDPVTHVTGGLLDAARRAAVTPKIYYTNTSHEYWGRSAALIHTSPDGTRDAEIPESTRIYLFAGLQHYTSPFPAEFGTGDRDGQQRWDFLPVRWFWRAMITSLNAWVRDGVEPPPSAYPRIADGTLVPLSQLRFPTIPGVSVPAFPATAYRLDFGPDWPKGIIGLQPPKVGEAFPVLVPQVDADGNDLAGIRLPELQAPIATVTGWNLRSPRIGAPTQRIAFLGSYMPFAATEAQRAHTGDSRASLQERYPSEGDYLRRYEAAAQRLVKARWLLEEDVPAVVGAADREWKAVEAIDAAP